MKIEAVAKTYQNKTVLDLPAFSLEEGCVTAVIGANGSGKSTLGKILAGIEKPDKGKAFDEAYKVGYMPQKSLAFRMSVEENILLNGSSAEVAEKLMEKLNLKELAKSRAKKLSGGETAKMALARSLMGEYDLLILDEPTASMDMESTLAAEQLIREYGKTDHHTILLITHSLKQAERVADFVIYLKQGQMIESGPAASVLFSPENEETRRFLDFYGL